MTHTTPMTRKTLLAACALALILAFSGCSGLLMLTQFAAAASAINSLFDNDSDDGPSYELSGYLYIDRTNNQVAIQNSPVPPATGAYEVFEGAHLILNTNPPMQKTTNDLGYFRFTGIPTEDPSLILTVEIPDATSVQFDIQLNNGTITPH